MTDVPFKVGDRVKKRSGNEYPDFIVSVFTNRAGAVRYVVEADHPAFSGMLHIFNGDQLEPSSFPQRYLATQVAAAHFRNESKGDLSPPVWHVRSAPGDMPANGRFAPEAADRETPLPHLPDP